MLAPCKNCQVRHEICHASCPDYLRFRKRIDEINEKKKAESDIKSYICLTRAKINEELRRIPKAKGERI